MPDLPDHGLSKDTVRADMARACAIVHGRGAKLSLLELCVLVMKDGLLNEREREELLERKLADVEGDNTMGNTLSSSPERLASSD
jgi:hypothetical protein